VAGAARAPPMVREDVHHPMSLWLSIAHLEGVELCIYTRAHSLWFALPFVLTLARDRRSTKKENSVPCSAGVQAGGRMVELGSRPAGLGKCVAGQGMGGLAGRSHGPRVAWHPVGCFFLSCCS
jgi:hypothetical protein